MIPVRGINTARKESRIEGILNLTNRSRKLQIGIIIIDNRAANIRGTTINFPTINT
jgi:hypothetical protein